MLDHLMETGHRLKDELRKRREMRQLLEQDERILKDIGVLRADVESALARPIRLGARREVDRYSGQAFYLDGGRIPHGRR